MGETGNAITGKNYPRRLFVDLPRSRRNALKFYAFFGIVVFLAAMLTACGGPEPSPASVVGATSDAAISPTPTPTPTAVSTRLPTAIPAVQPVPSPSPATQPLPTTAPAIEPPPTPLLPPTVTPAPTAVLPPQLTGRVDLEALHLLLTNPMCKFLK